MIEIDGAFGEGGGQLVRTAVALAAVQSVPVRVVNVRARRRNAGLAPQHVAAVRAVASMCDGHCEGVEPRSTAFSFSPGRPRGGRYRVDVGTAGSITLVLQAMLPVAAACGERCEISVRGGTDVRAAPPIDYFQWVLLPQLRRLGVNAALAIGSRGYYPRGGGEVTLDIEPTPPLTPFVIEQTGAVDRIELRAHVSRLPREIASRMANAAIAALTPALRVQSKVDAFAGEGSSPGGAIVLRALTARTVLGAARVAERGVRAEQLGQQVGQSVVDDLRSGATLDEHAADQMLAFLALARGESRFRVRELTSHARTAMWLIERLTPARFAIAAAARGVDVRVLAGQ